MRYGGIIEVVARWAFAASLRGPDMDWKKSFQSTIRDASGKLPEGRWPDDGSRFWQMGLEVAEETVETGMAEIRRLLASGAPSGGLLHVALLMHLLRTRLPGVQVSRLWPDVTALLASEGGRPDGCAVFFRELLRTHFRGRLAADSHHFQYVRLLLDEAGVGSGRVRIIVDFLTRLTEIPIGGSFDDAHLRELVQDEIRRDGRDDVEAIGPALFSAGEALLRVRRALLDAVDPAEIATWNWTDLAEFARRTAGRQLNYLIPEAERVFGALIPLLGRRMSCVRAFELMNTPGVSVRFPPDWNAASMPESEDVVPLGTVRVTRGIGVRDVFTVDENGFDAEFVTEQPADMWFRKRDGAPIAIWRRTPFEVRRRHQPRSRSRPVHDPKGCCIGHFWSGYASAGDGTTAVSRDAPYIEIPLPRATTLVPVPEWRWREGGFDLHLSRVAYYDLAERAEVELFADGLMIASRNVKPGNGLLETLKEIVFSRPLLMEGVALTLMANGRLIASALIRLPRRPLLIDGNRVFRARELARAPVRRERDRQLVLVGDVDTGEPQCSIGEVKSAGLEKLIGSRLAAFTWTVDTRKGVPAFSWGGFDWPGVEQTPVLATDLPREIDCGGYRLQGSGDVRPVRVDSQSESGVWIAGAAGLSDVDLLTRWGPLVSRRRIADDARVSISRLFADLPTSVSDRLFGLVMLSVERERIPMLEQLGLYVAPAALVPDPVRVGSRGRIALMDRAGFSTELFSTREADVDDPELFAEITLSKRDGLEPGSGVRFFWFADVYDIRLRVYDGPDLPSSTGSNGELLRPAALRSACFELVGDQSRWAFKIASEHVSLPMDVSTVMAPGGVLRELTRLLAGVDPVHPLGAVSVVAQYGGVPAETWAIDVAVVIEDVRAAADTTDGRLVLRIAFEWTGLPAREIGMSVEDADTPIKGSVFAEFAPGADGVNHHATARMDLPLATYAGMDLIVAPLLDRVPMRSIAVTVPELPVATDEIPAVLRGMLAVSQDGRNAPYVCRRATVLFARYTRERGTVPVDADRCAARVDRVFGSVDCAGTASATIRTIGMLLSDSVQVPAIRPPLSEEFSDFGLTVNEVIVDVLQREQNRGQLLPGSVDAFRRATELQRSAATFENALNGRLEDLGASCDRFTRC